MEETTYLAALAGMLHDIGKFSQRAGVGASPTGDEDAQRDFKYQHALLTADFIEKFVPEPWRLPVKNAASNHHRPQRVEDWAVALADRLSAGERSQTTGEDKASQPKQLLSVYCTVTADGQSALDSVYWPLHKLEFEGSEQPVELFPDAAWEDARVWSSYENLWSDFCEEVEALGKGQKNGGSLPTYIESLLMLLQRYTWCIPSAYYKSRPDISLYDHGRVTAALAAVLVTSGRSAIELEGLSRQWESSEEEIALLVGGDLSGLQQFLYTISAKGATSALRGRSFYLQLLTETIARFLLAELNLPATNLIYLGGGNFYILARPSDRTRLADAHEKISRILLGHHSGSLYLALASLPLKGSDLSLGNTQFAWDRLVTLLNQKKNQRFAELGKNLIHLFKPQGNGGNQDKQCQVCGIEHPETEEIKDGDETVYKCPQCSSYEELGKSLRKAEYLIFQNIPADPFPNLAEMPAPGSWEVVLRSFGARVLVAEDLSQAEFPRSSDSLVLALSPDAYQGLGSLKGTSASIGRRFLVNVTPLLTESERQKAIKKGLQQVPVAGSIKPFHILEAHSEGIPRLGVLRMDMDNLGLLFKDGLGKNASLSRIASLSFATSLFFDGWVETLAQRMNKAGGKDSTGERLYSIYSGGDDLFFVGAWDAVVEFARQVRIDLQKFVGGHPGLHASAGIVLVGGKYPLSQAAEDAHAALEKAKQLRWNENGARHTKDAVTFLGQTLPWIRFGLESCAEQNIHSAHAMMHLLIDEAKDTDPTPLIRRLLDWYTRYQEEQETMQKEGRDRNWSGQEQAYFGPWNWLSDYTLARMYRARKDENLKELREQLKEDSFRSIEWIGVAARWAELLLRQIPIIRGG